MRSTKIVDDFRNNVSRATKFIYHDFACHHYWEHYDPSFLDRLSFFLNPEKKRIRQNCLGKRGGDGRSSRIVIDLTVPQVNRVSRVEDDQGTALVVCLRFLVEDVLDRYDTSRYRPRRRYGPNLDSYWNRDWKHRSCMSFRRRWRCY